MFWPETGTPCHPKTACAELQGSYPAIAYSKVCGELPVVTDIGFKTGASCPRPLSRVATECWRGSCGVNFATRHVAGNLSSFCQTAVLKPFSAHMIRLGQHRSISRLHGSRCPRDMFSADRWIRIRFLIRGRGEPGMCLTRVAHLPVRPLQWQRTDANRGVCRCPMPSA